MPERREDFFPPFTVSLELVCFWVSLSLLSSISTCIPENLFFSPLIVALTQSFITAHHCGIIQAGRRSHLEAFVAAL